MDIKKIFWNKYKKLNRRPLKKDFTGPEQYQIKKYGGMAKLCNELNIPRISEVTQRSGYTKEEAINYIYDLMLEQGVNHMPKTSNASGRVRQAIFVNGGCIRLCNELGILSKKDYIEAVANGKLKVLMMHDDIKVKQNMMNYIYT